MLKLIKMSYAGCILILCMAAGNSASFILFSGFLTSIKLKTPDSSPKRMCSSSYHCKQRMPQSFFKRSKKIHFHSEKFNFFIINITVF